MTSARCHTSSSEFNVCCRSKISRRRSHRQDLRLAGRQTPAALSEALLATSVSGAGANADSEFTRCDAAEIHAVRDRLVHFAQNHQRLESVRVGVLRRAGLSICRRVFSVSATEQCRPVCDVRSAQGDLRQTAASGGGLLRSQSGGSHHDALDGRRGCAERVFTSGVTDLLGDLVMIGAIVAVMVYMDVRLTLITLLTVPMLFVATSWFRKGARRGFDM